MGRLYGNILEDVAVFGQDYGRNVLGVSRPCLKI
jgi:hypothetical protein